MQELKHRTFQGNQFDDLKYVVTSLIYDIQMLCSSNNNYVYVNTVGNVNDVTDFILAQKVVKIYASGILE